MLLGLAVLSLFVRRTHLQNWARSHRELHNARERGSHAARLQHPVVDLSQCIGCGACVRACPEDGVLSILHGQAVVVHGARCVGHGMCAAACPTGAISLTFGDLSRRRDLPVLDEDLEAVGVPGLFLAGELSGFALVRTAVAQGTTVADAVANRLSEAFDPTPATTATGQARNAVDLLIVGAGPGGLACSLRAAEHGLDFATIEQATRIGGTVAAYPRRKMVMTQRVELPLYGELPRLSYQKEELIDIWEDVVAKNRLPIRTGVTLIDLTRFDGDGVFIARTTQGDIRARNVCLALGRRGSPRKLGVPGEDLPKVAYSLLDAASYRDRRILVVGGGDSAVEAALALAEQSGNEVTVSYRKGAFFRLKARNDAHIAKAIHSNRLKVLFESEVVAIDQNHVDLELPSGQRCRVPNEDVFIFAGGELPFPLLERAGVSFDPALRPSPAEVVEPSRGVLRALTITLLCSIVLLVWGVWFGGYYAIDAVTRSASPMHRYLRPGGPVGLPAALVGCALFVWNLAYLIRRSSRLGRRIPGTLRAWMGWHVITGLLGAMCIVVHSGFTLRPTLGGHALLALAIVVATGIIGRYLYSLVPRAANGTEASLGDLRAQLANVSAEWDRDGRGFGTRVREQIDHLIMEGRWRPSFWARMVVFITGQFHLRKSLSLLQQEAKREGIPADEVRHVLMLARRAYRLTLLVTHYTEITTILSSWRYFHRWLGLMMVLLTILHIVVAMRYASLDLNIARAIAGGIGGGGP